MIEEKWVCGLKWGKKVIFSGHFNRQVTTRWDKKWAHEQQYCRAGSRASLLLGKKKQFFQYLMWGRSKTCYPDLRISSHLEVNIFSVLRSYFHWLNFSDLLELRQDPHTQLQIGHLLEAWEHAPVSTGKRSTLDFIDKVLLIWYNAVSKLPHF